MPSPTPAEHHVLRWNVLAVCGAVGVLVLVVAWWLGPGLFGSVESAQGTVAEAKVTLPMPCSQPGAKETVQFELNGQDRNGTLDGCGHGKDERVSIIAPADAGSGLIDVSLADVVKGHSDPRRPVGLALLAISCAAGGMYAFLVVRGPRRKPVLL